MYFACTESPEYLEKVFASAKQFRSVQSLPQIGAKNTEEIVNKTKNELPAINHFQSNNNIDDTSTIRPKDCANIDPDNLSPQTVEPTRSRKSRRARKTNSAKTPNSDKSPKPFENTLGNYLNFHSEASPSRQKSQITVPAKPEPTQDIEQQYINYVINLLEEDYENKFLSSEKINRNKFVANHQKPVLSQKIAPFNSNLPILNISKCLSPKKMPRHEQHRQAKPNHVTGGAILKTMPRKTEFKKSKKHSADCKGKPVHHTYGKLSKIKDRNQKLLERNADRHALKLDSHSGGVEFFQQNLSNFVALKSKFSQNINWQTLRVAQELLPRRTESGGRIHSFRQQLGDAGETSTLNANIRNLLLACGR